MYWDAIWIEENQVAQFMNELKAENPFSVEKDGCYWLFEFTTEWDYELAQEWDYAHNHRIYSNGDYIYYDEKEHSYGFCVNGKVVTGFDDPDSVEDAFWDCKEGK